MFLAGPTPRSNDVASWRPEALNLLRSRGFSGVVFVPENDDGAVMTSYMEQVEWERTALAAADVILFWVPRQLETMPAFTTNVEFGTWASSGKCVLGFPTEAPKCRYLAWLAERSRIPVCHELSATIDVALARLKASALRFGGEREVPLQIWHTPSFQAWYGAQKTAGNELRGAQQLWSYTPSRAQQPFSWILRVQVWVAAEQRMKANEWVFARSDLSAVVLHGPIANDWKETEVVLVREFRAPVRNLDGFVHELPGGSAYDPVVEPQHVAADEVEEEVGLRIVPSRLQRVQSRQVSATLSSHVGHVFRVALTDQEMARIRQSIAQGQTFGVGDSERTRPELWTPAAMYADARLDWSTLGMVSQALRQAAAASDPKQ